MSIGISEDHAALAETARRWAEQVVGAAGRRHGLEDEAGSDGAAATFLRDSGGFRGRSISPVHRRRVRVVQIQIGEQRCNGHRFLFFSLVIQRSAA